MTISDSQLKAAEKLFRDFHNREPEPGEIDSCILANGDDDYILAIGTLDAVVYSPTSSGKPYFHWLAKRNREARPLLCVTSDGKQMVVVRGQYRFTDRGFIG